MLLIHMYVLFTTMFAVNMFERKLSHVKVEKEELAICFFISQGRWFFFFKY